MYADKTLDLIISYSSIEELIGYWCFKTVESLFRYYMIS
jgi:hypothetical protein